MTRRTAATLLAATALTTLLALPSPAFATTPADPSITKVKDVATSSVTARLLNGARVTNGVTHYPALTSVAAEFQVLPQHAARVTITLQHQNGRTWRNDGVKTFTTTGTGLVSLGMTKGNRKMTYRFLARAEADAVAGASPTIVSPSFMVD